MTGEPVFHDKLALEIINGSIRPNRSGAAVDWIERQARQHGGYDVDVIDIAAHRIPLDLSTYGVEPNPDETVQALSDRLATADAFIVVTPEYNHSFPAPLKAMIDMFNSQWHAKPVAFVSYGGIVGGQRAVEQLRQVFCELHAMTIRETIPFVKYWEQFDDNGALKEPADAETAAKKLLDQLAWWGQTLRKGRYENTYVS